RDPQAIVTAGNASQQNDAAAACLVVAEDKLEELGLTPMLWFGGWAAAGWAAGAEPVRGAVGLPQPARVMEPARTNMARRLLLIGTPLSE
ncbi:MAG: hypothetical protein ACK46X_17225, partial [Candidatus Sericytochromatia bacterium]